MIEKIRGIVAATHTPFADDGTLDLARIAPLAEHLVRTGVAGVFIAGTTGEYASLTIEERLAIAERWRDVVRGGPLKLMVHVGSNCLADAKVLATHAERLGVAAIAALAPSYAKPQSLDVLIACCREIATAAPATPFYYYDIPSMTGVTLPTPEFLEQARTELPTLVGIKFSNPDLLAYQRCLHTADGRFDLPWGTDEYLLSALAVGAVGGVGSTYNFAAPLYTRLLESFHAGDLPTARHTQYRSAQLVHLLASFGFMPAAKAVMGFLGVPVGPARLPYANLNPTQHAALHEALERLGFFEWIRA